MKVSDHAIVRYMERFHELDVEQIKKEVVARIPHKDGIHQIQSTDMLCGVDKGAVVTMYKKPEVKLRPPKKPRHRTPRAVFVDEKRAVMEELWAGHNRFAVDAP